MSEQHGLGWLPDVPKPNDYTLDHELVAPLLQRTKLTPAVVAAAADAPVLPLGGARRGPRAAAPGGAADAAAPLPSKVDLTDACSPIEAQGALGSCTANAAAGLLEYFQIRAHGRYTDTSRMFIYKATRTLLGWFGDTGAYLRTTMEALTLFGAPPERYFPYDGSDASVNPRVDLDPPAFCFAYGSNFKAITYFRLDPAGASRADVLVNIRTAIAAKFPAMFGFPVYPEFDNPLPGGLIKVPAGSGFRGGHAICAVGYDDDLMIGADRGAFLVRNSWGTGWGNAGYAWMSYRYVTDGLAQDWWTMVSADWVNTAAFD